MARCVGGVMRAETAGMSMNFWRDGMMGLAEQPLGPHPTAFNLLSLVMV
jgi:hypothetical protein